MDTFVCVHMTTVELIVMYCRAAAAVTSVPVAQHASTHQMDTAVSALTDMKGISVRLEPT